MLYCVCRPRTSHTCSHAQPMCWPCRTWSVFNTNSSLIKVKKKKKVKYFPLQQIKKVFTRKRPDKVELKSSVIVKLLSTLKQPRECSASGLSDRSPAGNRGRHLQWHLYLFTGLDIREPLSSSREFHSALLLLHQVELKVKHLSLQADY